MSTRLSSYSKKPSASGVVSNFMDGTSYNLTPLETLKMVAASSIFKEPSYYRPNAVGNLSLLQQSHSVLKDFFSTGDAKTTTDVMTIAIDRALDEDFRGTLELAVQLRNEYNMRLNPSVIFVRAALHPKRVEFNQKNPNFMKEIERSIARRPDDITNQFEYFMFLKGSKNHLPNVVKRAWASKLSEYNRYQIGKYKSKSLIDLVRISHAHSEFIDELMKTGTLEVEDDETTWERLRSQGKKWVEILNTIKIPHMALLRNLRGIFTEINDKDLATKILTQLKEGVPSGHQFPYRYFTARDAVKAKDVFLVDMIESALEDCVDLAMANFPVLDGKTMCLTDNSGSAHGATTSEYGHTTVAEIDNLSSIMTAKNSDEGWVGVFGDRLEVRKMGTRRILDEVNVINKIGHDIGGGTENGIWLFWHDAIENKIHWDNVFIYSDQQASHGGLYGIHPNEYKEFAATGSPREAYIDVLKLVNKYRALVNPKVNVFSVQTAGYDNSVLPENIYRGAILTGWTGKETSFAKALIDLWNEKEAK
jgi:TROVE domain